MPAVLVPVEFFRSELRAYADWANAFVREFLQNSVDAGATQVRISIASVLPGEPGADGLPLGHPLTRVTVDDDGCGMSEQVLNEVFFAVGRSTKDVGTARGHAPEPIGGFGRARMLLCFAQTSYRVETGHLLAAGSGGQYRLERCRDHRPGCRFVIDLVEEMSSSRMRSAVRDALVRSQLPCEVRLDGELIPSGAAHGGRARRILRDDEQRPWGKVFTLPDHRDGHLLLRVRGLVMFSRWVDIPAAVAIEITPSRAREVLTANRDGLRYPFEQQTEELISDLAQNQRRALGEEAPVRIHRRGERILRTHARTRPAPAAAAEVVSESVHRGTRASACSVTADPDVFLLAAPGTRAHLLRRWSPHYWAPAEAEGRGRSARLLMSVWIEAVSAALDALLLVRPDVDDLDWAPGFVLDPGVHAVHQLIGDLHVFAVNPITDGGSRLQASRRTDRQVLFARAAHEVTHVVHTGHHEQYAGLLTEVVAALKWQSTRARPRPTQG